MQRIPIINLETPLRVTEVLAPPEGQRTPYILRLSPPVTVDCPHCGRQLPVRVAKRTRRIVDVPYDDCPVYLQVQAGHARCRKCRETVEIDLLPSELLEGRRVTRALGDYLLRQMGSVTVRKLAECTGLSYNVVHLIQKQLLIELPENALPIQVKQLGLDEIFIINGKFLVAVNHDDGKLLKIMSLTGKLEGLAGQGKFEAFFSDLPDAKTISLDMNIEQLDAVRRRWPTAAIVIDQRHLLEIVNKDITKIVAALILDEWRDHMAEQLPRRAVASFGNLAYPYLSIRHLVRRRRQNLTPADHATWLLIRRSGEIGQILYSAYIWKESLYDLYQISDKSGEFVKGLRTWLERVKIWQAAYSMKFVPLENSAKVISINQKYIENYGYHSITNARTELMNAGIRRHMRLGHRYKPETVKALLNRCDSAVAELPVKVYQSEPWVSLKSISVPKEPDLQTRFQIESPITEAPPSTQDYERPQPLKKPRHLPKRAPEIALPDDVWIWLHTRQNRKTSTVSLILEEAPAADYGAWSLLCGGQMTGREVPDVTFNQLQHWRAVVLRRYVGERRPSRDLSVKERERQPLIAEVDLRPLANQAPFLMEWLAAAWLVLAQESLFVQLEPQENAAMSLVVEWQKLGEKVTGKTMAELICRWEEVARAAGETDRDVPQLTPRQIHQVIGRPKLRFALAVERCLTQGLPLRLIAPLDVLRLDWWLALQEAL